MVVSAANTFEQVAKALRVDAVSQKAELATLYRRVYSAPAIVDVEGDYAKARVIRDSLGHVPLDTVGIVFSVGGGGELKELGRSTGREIPEAVIRDAITLIKGWDASDQTYLLPQGESLEYTRPWRQLWPSRYHIVGQRFPISKGEADYSGRIVLITSLDLTVAEVLGIFIREKIKAIAVVLAGTLGLVIINIGPVLKLTKALQAKASLALPSWVPKPIDDLGKAIETYQKSVETGQTLIDLAPAMLMVVKLPVDGSDAVFVYLNPAIEKQLGWEDLVGKPLNTIVPASYHHYHTWLGIPDEGLSRNVGMGSCPMHAHRSRVIGAVRPVTAVTKDGQEVSVLLSVERLPTGPDGSRFFAGTLVNVTELTLAKEAAEKANRTIEENQRIWRHDLLSSAKGAYDMLELLEIMGFEPEEKFAHTWGMAKRSSQGCYELIRNTRDLHGGNIKLNPCKALVKDLWDSLRPNYLAYNVVFTTPDEGATVVVDPAQFAGRALSNLINNAIKYGGGGLVVVSHANRGGYDLFIVKDQGPGLTPEQIDRITSGMGIAVRLNPEVEGTGLGLFSVRKIVEAHGGSLTVKSQVGKGSAFVLAIREVGR